jgi:hypothetical protein
VPCSSGCRVYRLFSAARCISSRELSVHIADQAYSCGSTVFELPPIVAETGIAVPLYNKTTETKLMKAQSAAGAADLGLMVNRMFLAWKRFHLLGLSLEVAS